MSDSLLAWHQCYVKMLQEGQDHSTALQNAGKTEEEFQKDFANNAAFKNAVALADAGVVTTELSAKELLKLRSAQVSEARIAGYFGLSPSELQEKIAQSHELSRIWNTGHLRGQAQLQMTQHVVALTGDTAMLTWLGKQHLEQNDKKTLEVDLGQLDDMISRLESKLAGGTAAKQIAKAAVDAEFEEIDQELWNADVVDSGTEEVKNEKSNVDSGQISPKGNPERESS